MWPGNFKALDRGGQMCNTLPWLVFCAGGILLPAAWLGGPSVHPPPLFHSSAFFTWCPLLLTSVHHQSKVSFFPFLPFSSITSSYSFSALELLRLSGQCPNPNRISYPCPVCQCPYSDIGAYQCSDCEAWLHFKRSGLPRAADWHPNWRCPAFSPPSSPSSSDSFHTPPFTPPPPPPLHIPHPHPPHQAHSEGSILQFNCNGIQNSHQEIISLLNSKFILVACIQETMLTSKSLLRPFPNYATLRRDRPGPSGGAVSPP